MASIQKGVNGGKKQHFLRVNRAEILAHAEKYGEASTMLKYNIKKSTWDSFINRADAVNRKMSRADKATLRAEIAEQGLREVKRDVNELKESYSRFVPHLADQITEKFFKPLLSGKIELPPELEASYKPSQLDITGFSRKMPRITKKMPRLR